MTALLLLAILATRQDTTRITELTVLGRRDNLIGTSATASTGRIGWRDLRLRPLAREGELLETVPGMILTQHSGDGKANQMFVRGFNLDHGTDFATMVDGMPGVCLWAGRGLSSRTSRSEVRDLAPEWRLYEGGRLGRKSRRSLS